ncbi:hypothetical protein T07_14530 [Trichinella nelsoni]|uniref:Uncharacterized protein n=1 Tax=Trichinella nelsoni TaxID=6336 RepID=A0A0V0RS58_9BILA|nr:hypothetical protein T07_14530 [Trichinella nelsoni]
MRDLLGRMLILGSSIRGWVRSSSVDLFEFLGSTASLVVSCADNLIIFYSPLLCSALHFTFTTSLHFATAHHYTSPILVPCYYSTIRGGTLHGYT